jgi:biopolymer transport protein ExbD
MKIGLFSGEFEEEPGLPLTPMIDIIFLLLIFYISIGRIQQVETQLGIRIPTAEAGEPGQRTIGDVIVNIDATGGITVNNQPMTIEDLERRLLRLAEISPGQSVIIRSDGAAQWDQVSDVLDACSVADIWNIKFAVVPEETP